MLNYWMFPRPFRKLTGVPLLVAVSVKLALGREWAGQRQTQINFEEALEQEGLKRPGERRDGSGSGGRTHQAALKTLGLVFNGTDQHGVRRLYTTLAGDALAKGSNPIPVLTEQVMKNQFPCYQYSGARGLKEMAPRFKVRPFVFILQLLLHPQLGGNLTQEETAKLVVTYGESNSPKCVEDVVDRILKFRTDGDSSLEADFDEKFGTSWEQSRAGNRFGHLLDVANTALNWLEYTLLTQRELRPSSVSLIPSQVAKAQQYVDTYQSKPLLRDHTDEAKFQRAYGLAPGTFRDNRNLTRETTVTLQAVMASEVNAQFVKLSTTRIITGVDAGVVREIRDITGFDEAFVQKTLQRLHPNGELGPFLTKLNEMAHQGREDARDFELATAEVFRKVFGFEAEQIGQHGRQPDIWVKDPANGYSGIIDNKAIKDFSISHTAESVMANTYIPAYRSNDGHDLAFFMYIAAGLKPTINRGLSNIIEQTGVGGSAIDIATFIDLVLQYEDTQHESGRDALRDLFSIGRAISLSDVEEALSTRET
jgi:hypothetical protein